MTLVIVLEIKVAPGAMRISYHVRCHIYLSPLRTLSLAHVLVPFSLWNDFFHTNFDFLFIVMLIHCNLFHIIPLQPNEK